ncbi:MAG TPA: PQQ-binding-like beta-propeller repeat protein [Planctomycetota bacterium]
MGQMIRWLVALAVMASLAQSGAQAENWPGFRGPRGDGTSLETQVPTTWSAAENIAWKTTIPGAGYSSPIVWEDRIFLTTAIPAAKDRILLCFDRKTGKTLWQKTVINAPLEPKNGENSYASSTPVTDGEKVYVTFLEKNTVVVAAYDMAGEQKWIVRPGRFDAPHGFCHSPLLWDNKVLLACCGNSLGFVAALDRADGKTVWCVESKKPVMSFCVPMVKEMAGRAQFVVPGNGAVTSYDPKDGKELWIADGPSKEFVPSPIYLAKADAVLVAGSWPARILMAVKPDGEGNVTTTKVLWKAKEGAPYVPSPLAIGDYVLTASWEPTSLVCLDAATGNTVWKQEGVGKHHASPFSANGLVYFTNDEGVTTVLKPGPKFEAIAKNPIGEKTYAPVAISQGQIFMRTLSTLFCVGAPK